MPELPEVEMFARGLRTPLIGQSIIEIWNDWPRHIARPAPAEFARRLKGRSFQEVGRRGKYLVFTLDNDETLLVHLKMSGHLSVQPKTEPAGKHVHTTLVLAGGHELRFRDTRKFGRVYLVRDPLTVLGELGPEPLSSEFSPQIFENMLAGRRRVLKPLLLDQTFIAGIGNIYADEALFHAGILPTRHSHSLTPIESRNLHAGIQKALSDGIHRGGASISDYRQPDGSLGEMQDALVAYGRAGKPCLRCGGIISRIVLAGRSTHYCSGCQS